MFYEYHLTISPSTPQSTPATLNMPLDFGIIVQVEVEFPPGCYGLAGVRVIEREHQVFPTNDGEWFISDAYVIRFSPTHDLREPPYALRLEGYNDDTIYPHRITVRFAMIRPEKTLAKKISDIFFGMEKSPFE